MQLGLVGLGRMGANMTRRLMRGGHELVVSDLSADSVKTAGGRRRNWIDVTRGSDCQADASARNLGHGSRWCRNRSDCAETGSTPAGGRRIIDGGNSYFKDDVRRANELKSKGIHYIDVGTSGGVWGLERGYCMMIGGPKEAVQRLDPIFKTLAPGKGDIPRTPEEKNSAAPPKLVTFTAVPRDPGTSSRWCTTALSTASCRPMRGLRHFQERDQQRFAGGHAL